MTPTYLRRTRGPAANNEYIATSQPTYKSFYIEATKKSRSLAKPLRTRQVASVMKDP